MPLAADPAADALAESFARAYLTWDGRTADRLAAFGTAIAPPQVIADVRQRVEWTTVSESRLRGAGRLVTIAAQTNRGPYHLSVVVRRAGGGALAVVGSPALVGGAPIEPTTAQPAETPVDDEALTTVVRRSVTNYLAGDRSDLLADLDAGARIALPDQVLHLRDADDPTWVARPHRAAVELRAATGPGVELTLRYELEVVRRGGRWLVRSINTDPIGR
jgi:hypothetical protein